VALDRVVTPARPLIEEALETTGEVVRKRCDALVIACGDQGEGVDVLRDVDVGSWTP